MYRYADPNMYLDGKPSFQNKMTVSAPTTPAHADRLLNLQSESLAWLDKAALNSNMKSALDDFSNNEYTEYQSHETDVPYQMVDESKRESGDLIQFANGWYHIITC